MDNADDTPEKALPHVLTALLAKRKELERAIYVLNNQLRTANHDLDVVKAALRIFKGDRQLPDHSITRPAVASFRGAPMHAVFTAIRASPTPLSTECLTQIVMKESGLALDDPNLCRAMQRRVRTSLNYYRRVRGVFRSVPGPNRSLLWELAVRLDEDFETAQPATRFAAESLIAG